VSALLELDNLTVRYGQIEALRGIRIAVQTGEIVTLIGATGRARAPRFDPLAASCARAPG
jgi:ABC-type branched-subunit amino acid transport system ATPase component